MDEKLKDTVRPWSEEQRMQYDAMMTDEPDAPSILTQLESNGRCQCPIYPHVIGCDICMRQGCRHYKGFVPMHPRGAIECYEP